MQCLQLTLSISAIDGEWAVAMTVHCEKLFAAIWCQIHLLLNTNRVFIRVRQTIVIRDTLISVRVVFQQLASYFKIAKTSFAVFVEALI